MPSRFNSIRSQERPKPSYFQISVNIRVTRGNKDMKEILTPGTTVVFAVPRSVVSADRLYGFERGILQRDRLD